MDNKILEYQVPQDANIDCPPYFRSTPLSQWSVYDYMQYEGSGKKLGKLSEQFYNALETIQNSEGTPNDVKRLLNSTLPRVSA